MIQTTLNFLIEGDKVLLAMKKRGFGAGKWNGVGGKLRAGENPTQAIIRESAEEIGVTISPKDIVSVGVMDFHFTDRPDWDQRCHVFVTRAWQGEPAESEEMRPQWYGFADVPYDSMWIDDKHWLPFVLQGKNVKATFHFSNGGADMVSHDVKTA
ncbi:MAG TPA: 8-oxo-dGTP diphosphatase [Thermodesulfobacteriota bacterium]|nr:8-oxo-dGTP diphosphatase [Candidatus Paceibacterota bacterium]HVY56203.1 8-oxo-dGTP diphosphatase [Thermodesulfobacteriota bacterium]